MKLEITTMHFLNSKKESKFKKKKEKVKIKKKMK